MSKPKTYICPDCGTEMVAVLTREDSCRMMECPNCHYNFCEETDEWFREMGVV